MNKIAAVMLTGHNPARRKMAEVSLQSFLEQTDVNSVLRIFNQSSIPLYTGASNRRVRETFIQSNRFKSLGDLKTWAINQCAENWVVLWDDDDFPSSSFLSYFRRQPLEDSLYRLQNITVWDLETGVAYAKRLPAGFSGPLFFDRRKFSRFMPINTGENWSIRGSWSRALALNNPPSLYIRTWNSYNTLLKCEVIGSKSTVVSNVGPDDTKKLNSLSQRLAAYEQPKQCRD